MGSAQFLLKILLAFAVASATVALEDFASRKADYIIVGGGPAGFVLAEKLSRNPLRKIVLLEAGPETIHLNLVSVPAYYPLIHEYFWNYTSQPDVNLGGRAPGLRQGRGFGGGSAVNGMAYCRGAASVFDEWAAVSKNPNLAWGSLIEDFKATTHYTHQPADYELFVNTTGYGDGPLEVSRMSGLTGFEAPFVKAVERGLNMGEVDQTDGTGIGIDRGVATIRVSDRTRSYPRNTFGSRMQGRQNVELIHNAWVYNIGFSGQTAVNVTYINTSTNKKKTLEAIEIIISSGAINSPKLLMLSGIGPKKRLLELGIPIVANIPEVGTNLYDHQFPIIEAEVTPDVLTVWQWFQNATQKALAEKQYKESASGPLGWNNGFVHAGFRIPDSVFKDVNGTHYTSLPADRPQALIEFSTVPFHSGTPNISVITGWASLVQPEAPGYVTLKSADYRDDPLIFSNYYGSDADKAAVLWSYKKLREIMASDELKSVVIREWYPGSNVTTDEDIWAAIQQQSFSFHHPVGTIALGKALDSNWRLKGLRGIRVVGSSTFPTPSTCHPQGVVYAIAHRAARDIEQADRTRSGGKHRS
ncbi:choline dehydrogenase [Nannizzia gypsea CBS 118893]|uniref:Choline dehydrogenase n=1 Tax=Arthroderma gypseum (strain ATCC MYA-4604 / CBS 118893) TaxID=535722 RepID=E4V650_ARTGP|nr:choline dehydrogenase [Nannizzia gypsea CBS 118893]EFR05233.1 choline dehydrogenase [Nannizzia gypsea CBS 118893]